MEFNDSYYDSLLDDDVKQEPIVEPEPDSTDDIPLVPDQDFDPNDPNDPNNGDNHTPDDEDVIISYLKSTGISDPTKIKFETDEGETEERD